MNRKVREESGAKNADKHGRGMLYSDIYLEQ